MTAPRNWYTVPGVLGPYLLESHGHRIYRCPSLKRGLLFSGIGSNGMHDYCMVSAFTGAALDLLPKTVTIYTNVADRGPPSARSLLRSTSRRTRTTG